MSAHTKRMIRWLTSERRVIWAVVVGVLLALTILVVLGYILEWEWVGVAETYRPRPKDSEGTPQDIRRMKTLWDWLGLLVVPAVLAIGGFALSQRAKRQEEAVEQRAKQREKQRTLLLKLYDDFFQNYSVVLRTRRMLKAKGTYLNSDDGRMVRSKPYDEQMAPIIEVHQQFERLLEDLETIYAPVLEADAVLETRQQQPSAEITVRQNLEKMEKYLNKLVAEYEMVYNTRVKNGRISRTEFAARDLPVLEDFLSSRPFRDDFVLSARSVSVAIHSVISSME